MAEKENVLVWVGKAVFLSAVGWGIWYGMNRAVKPRIDAHLDRQARKRNAKASHLRVV